jgi:PAS domain S-box-containing protein
LKASKTIIALLALAAVLVVLGLGAAFWTVGQITESSNMRRHTSLVLSKANELQAALTDSETAMRGFVITGDETFLGPYNNEKSTFSGRLEELRQLATIGAAPEHVAVLIPLVNDRLASIDQAIALKRSADPASAITFVQGGEGQRLTDAVRAEISSIKQIEEAALAQREAAFETNMRRILAILVGSSVFVLLLALLFGYLIYRETRQQLQNRVHHETENFLRVQEETNKQLQQVLDTLLVSEEKLAVTLNSIGDAVIATDADGLIALLNPLAEKLTGWTSAEAIGQPIEDVFHIINEESRQPTVSPVAATLALGTVHGLANHTVVIARDGSERAIADSCAPIRNRDDCVVGAVLVFRDVTERNRLDQALKEKNEALSRARIVAEDANLAKSEFLSSMSHELRSPLNAILGFAQLMDTDTPRPTPEQQASIAQILQAGWHLLKLIDEILDLTRIESGQVALSMEPVPLSGILLECQGMIEPQAKSRGIQLVFPADDPSFFVRADQTRVTQVLVNLLSNAVKYNSENGTIEVTCVEVSPGRVRVGVRDSGAGLSQDQLGQLFQAFNRLGQEAGGVEGTGIGLVVAKQLVELMDGTIGVESTVGTGSVFWFELASVAGPSLGENSLEAPVIRPKVDDTGVLRTLLYVEDNPANLNLVEQIIARRPDLRLLTAVNGNNGIKLAREFKPDVILMDINLPDISGLEVLALLRAFPATSYIPVVAVSANAMPRDVKKGLEAGFFRYITKPIMVDEFMDAVDEALEFADLKSDEAS